ncbi:Uncharacterised protein [Collinsella aerofaciens]|uniref:Uncharacterized protein n=1 Tax=Collinsella aerofaciens TaxID=74426 RepID=A0A5K1JG54_9ACTN|nr:Uncharacterised protein [Collinsella aerofaciens]
MPHLENPYIWLDGRAGGFGRLLGQSCSHGEHIKCSPARAELAIDQSSRRALFLVAFRLAACERHFARSLFDLENRVG